MSYALDPGAPLTDALRKVADDQIRGALESLERASTDPEEAVHDTRKRCKKLRALLRLVRPGLGGAYRKENMAFRDIAGSLSDVRDAQVLAETVDGLAEGAEDEATVKLLRPLREWARARRGDVLHEKGVMRRIDAAHGALARARKRAARWEVAGPAPDALRGGLERTYGRARRRWREATPEGTPELMHEWRKRVKYQWYHCRLMRKAWPDAIKVRAAALDELGDRLGADHDLAVLVETLRADGQNVPPAAIGAAMALAAERSGELRAGALRCAPRLFVEKPKALSRRLFGQWSLAA